METPEKPVPSEHYQQLQWAPKPRIPRMKPRTLFNPPPSSTTTPVTTLKLEDTSQAKKQIITPSIFEKMAKSPERSSPYSQSAKKSRVSLPLMSTKNYYVRRSLEVAPRTIFSTLCSSKS